jgi:hypothetical protein
MVAVAIEELLNCLFACGHPLPEGVPALAMMRVISRLTEELAANPTKPEKSNSLVLIGLRATHEARWVEFPVRDACEEARSEFLHTKERVAQ